MYSTTTYNINTWYHAVMTVEPIANTSSPIGVDLNVKKFVNGIEESFSVFQFYPVSADEAFIGKFNATNS